MAGIFVSYRRDETTVHAGWLAAMLSEHFGEQNVFLDIESIEPGLDFVEAMQRGLARCEVVLVVIGKSWLTTMREKERQGHEDYSRLEVATALKSRSVRVVPVLVQEAAMPSVDDLPGDLTDLSRRSAFELRDTRWASDVGQLVSALKRVLGTGVPKAEAGTAGRYGISSQDQGTQLNLEQRAQTDVAFGTIIVRRLSDAFITNRFKLSVLLDGKKVASLSNREEVKLPIHVGPHSIQVSMWDDTSDQLLFTLQNKEIVHFTCSGGALGEPTYIQLEE